MRSAIAETVVQLPVLGLVTQLANVQSPCGPLGSTVLYARRFQGAHIRPDEWKNVPPLGVSVG